jgi:hypothetical protein
VMRDHRTPPAPFDDSNAAAHFKAGSALLEFIAGRLGAPACWPNESRRKHLAPRASDEMSSIQRWESDGGKTIATSALAKRRSAPPQHFHATRPLLTQLI